MAFDPKDLRDDQIDRKNPQVPLKFDHLKVIQKIQGMLVGVEYEYAEDTLRSILEWVKKNQRVTEGQWTAIQNIADNPSRSGSAGRRSQRWYGG